MADAGEDRRWARVGRAVPIFRWLPSYKLSNLRGDLMAGLIVGALAKLFMPGKDPGGIIITIPLSE